MLRTLAGTLAALAFAATVAIAAPSPAAAVTVPPPVAPSQILPSLAAKAAGSNPGLIVEMMLSGTKWVIAPPPLATIPKPVAPPVPISAFSTVARAAGAAGALLTAANIGWGLGQGGLRMLSAVTGTSYDDGVCSAPDWYQGVNSFFMFGNVPECAMPVLNPNADQPESYGQMCIPSSTVCAQYVGIKTFSSSVWAYCWKITGTPLPTALPGDWKFRYPYTDGSFGQSSTVFTAPDATCGGLVPTGRDYWVYKAQQYSDGSYKVGSNIVAKPSDLFFYNSQTLQKVQQPVDQPDPPRTPTCTIKWKDGSTTTGTGQTYNESTGLPLSSSGLGCEAAFVSQPGAGPDLLPDEITVDSQVNGGGAKTEISKSTVPSFTAEEAKAMVPSKPGGGLVLEKTVNGVTDSCNTWAANCSGWWTATANGTQTSTSTGTYRCTFSGDTVTLNQCGIYRNTFETQTSTPTVTDPATGLEKPWVAKPSTGNSIDPSVGVGDSPSAQCFADGWASVANPVDWVLVPVKCALVWAFVPRQSAIDDGMEGLRDQFDQTSYGAMFTGLGSMVESFNIAAGGCGGLPFHLEGPGWAFSTALFAACEEPMAGIAATVNGLLVVIIGIGGFLAVTRYVGAIFGYVPYGGPETTQYEEKGVRFK